MRNTFSGFLTVFRALEFDLPASPPITLQRLQSAQSLLPFRSALASLARRSLQPERLWQLQCSVSRVIPTGFRQRILVLRTRDSILAVVFLLERVVCGLPTGYFTGDDSLGETLILCERGREHELLALALEHLFARSRAFLVELNRPLDAPNRLDRVGGARVREEHQTRRWQHSLGSNLDETFAPFGARTRRNLRHSLRAVQKKGWQFLPELTPDQTREAMCAMASTSTHPFSQQMAEARLRSTSEIPGSFSMALTDASGKWLSLLSGRRLNGITDIFWHSNLANYRGESLATTMRALLMKEEVQRGSACVRYIAGTTALLQHFCTPTPSKVISMYRPGLRHQLLSHRRNDTA